MVVNATCPKNITDFNQDHPGMSRDVLNTNLYEIRNNCVRDFESVLYRTLGDIAAVVQKPLSLLFYYSITGTSELPLSCISDYLVAVHEIYLDVLASLDETLQEMS